ncbi:hypothetical protein [Rhodanobacter ginsengiterrae]|uniref:hypothetical protein n=1 Tax=Rhodanobacter ginsengiterrae TaxID=2008451 RepID=UPI003CF23601
MTNEQLAEHVLAQQRQLAELATKFNALTEANLAQANLGLHTQQCLQGFHAAFQVFAELVMAANPAVKEFIGNATTQMLARPEAVQNETFQQLVQAWQAAATSAPRTTPEGRRANFQVLSGGDPAGEP